MSEILQRLADTLGLSLPPYGMGAALVLLLYAIQSEVRFGAKARTMLPKRTDRASTVVLSLASLVPVVGFVVAMQPTTLIQSGRLPTWLFWPGATPNMIAAAWIGVWLGVLGLLLRLWAVLTLRQRYTRTLLVHDDHSMERRGPYRFVRHPGYLGSLLSHNGIAFASCSIPIFVASISATLAAYGYRIRVEEAMLVATFGERYEEYRRGVAALVPFVW
jgi:protein-S-isoprenylcysteine O-methyltransferase Ste14